LLNAHEIRAAPPRLSSVTTIEQAQSPFPRPALDLRPCLGEDAAVIARDEAEFVKSCTFNVVDEGLMTVRRILSRIFPQLRKFGIFNVAFMDLGFI
jgi:hypothetical protein